MTSQRYYGIDLGTTNSLIGLYAGADFHLFQNRDRMNATPSAVYLRSAHHVIVGQKALELIKDDPSNGALEFKRMMGRSDPIHFPRADIELTPTELSAEILKSLTNDIMRLRGGQKVDSAIITVPASFGIAPCRATLDAAKKAGIENVMLLQEPVAAAIAYGVQPGVEDENWLVFDLGGGTFDVAIVSTRNLNLTVISHAGDRYLGGKDIDRRLVEKVTLPYLASIHSLPREGTEAYKSLFEKLLRKAEEAKIALTYEDTFLLDLFNLGSDDNGSLKEAELEISRRTLQACAEELIERCLVLCEQAMDEARIRPDQVTKVLLVGGSTQMPYVRERVAEGLGIEVECSRDPITAIVEGASFFGLMQEDATGIQIGGNQELDLITDVDVVPGSESAIIRGRVDGAEGPVEAAVSLVDRGC